MDQLINLVAEKAGIAPDRARTAVETVMSFLKSKLPTGLGDQLDQAARGAGAGGMAAGIGNAAKGLGGMFGNKP